MVWFLSCHIIHRFMRYFNNVAINILVKHIKCMQTRSLITLLVTTRTNSYRIPFLICFSFQDVLSYVSFDIYNLGVIFALPYCWNILNPLITQDQITNHYLINYSPTRLISWHPLAPQSQYMPSIS